MNDDLIKRSDAIEMLQEAIMAYPPVMKGCGETRDSTLEEAINLILDIPSADRPKREWIPCSERLPSEQGQYLVTFLLCNGDPWVYVLSFCKGKFYETDDEWGDVEYDDVTAWMPLPKPYGREESE